MHPIPPPPLLTMIAALIAEPSMSAVSPQFDHSNRRVIDLLANWLDGLGFSIEIDPLVRQPNKANLIATLGRGAGGLVLAGHTDTVPYDLAAWRSDPFTLTERDGRLYGLGTSDMKAFFALAIEAARDLRASELSAPLIILATADEESSMEGAQQLVDRRRPLARHAVIGEPTNLKPIRAHKGIMMEAIRLTGHSGHSSDPGLGRNALEGMHRAIGALLDWRAQLQQRYHDHRFHIPIPTLNLGHIHGGDNPNRICGECELHFDLRTLPGMAMADLRTEIAAVVTSAVANSDLEVSFRPLFHGIDAMETNAEAAIVTSAERLTGHASEVVAFGTEGPFLNQLGMDTLILGPGDIAQAHQPDEYLALDRLHPTVTLLRQLIDRFCRHGD
jgi:acetylornithine deacetylase